MGELVEWRAVGVAGAAAADVGGVRARHQQPWSDGAVADGRIVSFDGGRTRRTVVAGAATVGRRRCAGCGRGQKAPGADGSGKPAAQRLWANGEYDFYLL